MAKQPVTIVHEDDFEDDDQQSQGPKGTESMRRTANLMESMAGTDQIGDGYINVTQVEGGTESRCLKVPADKYSYDDLIELVRHDFGAGDFRFRLYVRNAQGRYQLAENRLETLKVAKSPTALAALPAPAAGGDALLRELVNRQQQQMETLLEQQRQNLASNRPDLLATLERVAIIATPFVPVLTSAFGRRSSGGIAELKGMLELAGTIKDMREPGAPEVPEGSPVWATLLSQGLQMLPAMMSRLPAPAAAPAAPATTALAPALGAPVAEMQDSMPAPVVIGDISGVGLPDVRMFAAQVPLLIQSAQSDMTPEMAAKTLFAQLPATHHAEVLETVSHPLFLKAMVKETNGTILDVMDWVTYMREEFIDLLESSLEQSSLSAGKSDAAGHSGGNTGNSGNPAGHETPGQESKN